jgi:YrbI family 3-deoxy-D-manno-octulosonate 8-phosphate phosphatase
LKFEWGIFDVDGVFTDGSLFYGPNGEMFKVFNVKDGHGIKLLKKLGIKMAVISGKGDLAVEKRLNDLQFDDYIFNRNDKGAALDELAKKHGDSIYNSFCIGDDLPDLELFNKCKFSFAVGDAVSEVKNNADHLLKQKGGKGAVREMATYILDNYDHST